MLLLHKVLHKVLHKLPHKIKMLRTIAWRIALISLCLGISACGFSLRSNETLSTKFNALQLDLELPNSEFSQLLQQNLEIASVAVSPPDATAQQGSSPVLRIDNELMVSRPVSVNPRARAAQYELRLSIDVALTSGAESLLGPETLLVERSYFEDIENIAGNQEEMTIISGEMRRELVNQLMRRLEAVSI